MSRLAASCREARAVAAGEPADLEVRRRVELHRVACADCDAYLERLARAALAVIAAAGPVLDDLQRTRIRAGIDAALAHSPRRPALARSMWPAALALALAAVLLLFVRLRSRPLAVPPSPIAVPALLEPYVVAGEAAHDAGSLRALRRPVDRLEVPEGGVVRAMLGGRARVTLVGPARLAAWRVAPDIIDLRLDQGLLLGDYDHERGGTLRVSAPGLVTTIVGTVFAIDARSSRVAVLRGRVEVRAAGTSLRLDAGWSYRAGAADREPLDAATAALLVEQAAALGPPRGRSALLVLQGTPDRAEARLGDAPLGPTPLAARLPSGIVRLMVTAPGHRALVLPATIPDEDSLSLRYALPTDADPHATGAVAPSAKSRPARPATAVVAAPANPLPARMATTTTPAKPADSAPASAPPAPAAPPRETADDVYTRAEAAMRAGDASTARARLEEVVRRFPAHPLADAALYDLARLSLADDPVHAGQYLDALLARGIDPTLREPASFLRCRLVFDAHLQAAASRCLETFRSDFPSSSHDAEVLALLIGLAQARRDCRTAEARIDEYLRLYPTGPFAGEAAGRRSSCGR